MELSESWSFDAPSCFPTRFCIGRICWAIFVWQFWPTSLQHCHPRKPSCGNEHVQRHVSKSSTSLKLRGSAKKRVAICIFWFLLTRTVVARQWWSAWQMDQVYRPNCGNHDKSMGGYARSILRVGFWDVLQLFIPLHALQSHSTLGFIDPSSWKLYSRTIPAIHIVANVVLPTVLFRNFSKIARPLTSAGWIGSSDALNEESGGNFPSSLPSIIDIWP